MRCRIGLLAIGIALVGCAPQPNPYDYDLPGPTLMARTADGYTLTNRRLQLLLDANTGDVLAFGPKSGAAPIAIAATIHGEIHPMRGYLEARDIEAWEYLGNETSDAVSWRKIYCLDGDRLLVTYLVRNEGKTPIDIQIGIAPMTRSTTQPEMAWTPIGPNDDCVAAGGYRIKCYNESIVPAPPPPEILRNDPRKLAPGEGIAWTMVWTFEAPSSDHANMP